ncbi:hypothetical protein BDV06DRAFT_228660 [Aspergillus oleicola]
MVWIHRSATHLSKLRRIPLARALRSPQAVTDSTQLFDVVDKQEHARKRKTLSAAFAVKHLERWEHKVFTSTECLLNAMDAHCTEHLKAGHTIPDPKDVTMGLGKIKDGEPWGDIVYHQAVTRLNRSFAGEQLDELFSSLWTNKQGHPNNLEWGEIIGEVGAIINAGSDTTAIALTQALEFLLNLTPSSTPSSTPSTSSPPTTKSGTSRTSAPA